MAVIMSIYNIIKFRATSIGKNLLWPMEYARVSILGRLMGSRGSPPMWGADEEMLLNKGNGIN
jgi:hypothetical protein